MVRLLSLLHPFKTLRAPYYGIPRFSVKLHDRTYTASVWQQQRPGAASSSTGHSPMGSEDSGQSQGLVMGFIKSSSKL